MELQVQTKIKTAEDQLERSYEIGKSNITKYLQDSKKCIDAVSGQAGKAGEIMKAHRGANLVNEALRLKWLTDPIIDQNVPKVQVPKLDEKCVEQANDDCDQGDTCGFRRDTILCSYRRQGRA